VGGGSNFPGGVTEKKKKKKKKGGDQRNGALVKKTGPVKKGTKVWGEGTSSAMVMTESIGRGAKGGIMGGTDDGKKWLIEAGGQVKGK